MVEKRFKGFYVEDRGYGISDCILNVDWLIETRGDLEEFLKSLNALHEENQNQKREYRELYDELQDVYKSYREELRKNIRLAETIHHICAEHHINSKCYLEEDYNEYMEEHSFFRFNWSENDIMTAKRFEYKNHKVYDNLTDEFHSSHMVSVNVLNELSEENKKLKQKVNNKIKKLEKERKSAIGGTWHSGKLIAQIEILEELKEELR